MIKKRVGVLISGRGSNLVSLIEACGREDFPAEIVTVISNRPEAAGLDHARRAGIEAEVVNHKSFASRHEFDTALDEALTAKSLDLICNAGFMRLLGSDFVNKWRDRQLNIHPSLLPSFKGLHTHERVLEAGVRITGCTVHFVRHEMDTGPIIAQAAVPALPGDTASSLAARVLQTEHHLYPHALYLVASGRVTVSGERVVVKQNSDDPETTTAPGTPDTLFAPPLPTAAK